MNKFLDLLEQSVIVQAVITALVVVTVCILVLTGRPVPEIMATFASLILGYYFGSKNAVALQRMHRAQNPPQVPTHGEEKNG